MRRARYCIPGVEVFARGEQQLHATASSEARAFTVPRPPGYPATTSQGQSAVDPKAPPAKASGSIPKARSANA